jgi:nucleoid-associated protein YgaU
MHAHADDSYPNNGWAQLPSALTATDSTARHAHPVAVSESVPVPTGPMAFRKEAGPPALGLSAARSTRRRPTHLTRRGRLVLILLTTCLVAVAFGAGRASATSAPTAAPPSVVVHPGDTLWSIAARVAGGTDIRETVEQIIDLNGVAAQSIEPGQRLVLPDE